MGDRRGIVRVQGNLIFTFWKLGDLVAAKAALAESLVLAREIGTKPLLTIALLSAACMAHADGKMIDAAHWLGAITLHGSHEERTSPILKHLSTELTTVIGLENFEQLMREGQTLNLDTLIEDAWDRYGSN
jgi:hypothetical protein